MDTCLMEKMTLAPIERSQPFQEMEEMDFNQNKGGFHTFTRSQSFLFVSLLFVFFFLNSLLSTCLSLNCSLKSLKATPPEKEQAAV